MKNKSLLKKGIGILLLLIMSAGVLSGCGKTSSEEEGISVYRRNYIRWKLGSGKRSNVLWIPVYK